MQLGALLPYEQSLRTRSELALMAIDGRVFGLDVARWSAPADAVDALVLDRCSGPTLDVGCGPGRFVAALAERGIAAMGLDIAETAVALTRSQGGAALLRSVFARVPGEGRWPTVLLMDGNVGIGGDPTRLLARVHGLLRPGGRLIVETDPDYAADETVSVRFTQAGRALGPVFNWARVGVEALHRYASQEGYGLGEGWSEAGRSFVALER